mmetsp:Transcript_21116/g.44014  ORF Transcript_21116/g.44014 Transcript_21116/m.44014 type:complete len:898 (+) Transcript_21116:1-2694(+)
MRLLLFLWLGLLCPGPVSGELLGKLKNYLDGASSGADATQTQPLGTPQLTKFINWFQEMGGTINPHVTIASFDIFGNGLATTSTGGVSEDEVLFKASSNMILTRPSIAKMYRPYDSKVSQAIMNASDDNYAIATQFVVECAIGDKSKFEPYMNVLPKEVMKLETFTDDELEMLQSPALVSKGKRERANTVKAYAYLEPIMKSMLSIYTTNLDPTVAPSTIDESCLSFESFSHFSAVVGSRAMVMQGIKYMTPMADMANYQPRDDERAMENGNTFLRYHVLGEDGSMTVKADQSVPPSSQIFEDYGDNPNSLYLEAHGFVPFANPFNCADLLNPPVDDQEVMDIMKALHIVSDDGWSPEACVDKNGDILPNTRSYAYYAVAALKGRTEEMRYCKDNIGDRMNVGKACIRWAGSVEAVRELVKSAAASTLSSYSTTIEEDVTISEDKGLTPRAAMAVSYRLALKNILRSASGVAVKPALPVKPTPRRVLFGERQSDDDDDGVSLQKKVENFNAFIDSLKFPTNHLVAYVAGDGMRVGTKAAQDIKMGTSYIDVPVTAVMSSENAKTSSPDVNALIEKGKSMKDDFHTLLFFLMHERFNAKKDSFWWPYLALLPTLEEYKEYHPTFMSEDKLSGLDGSGVKERIMMNQRKAKKAFESVSKDATVIEALGPAWNEDNYMWATTILDSRSIWWSGARHLVPLLDLINCQQLPKGSTVHATALDSQKKNAVTLAPWNFKKGEQVFENYGQPSHIYFIYHGFVLEDNDHDCSLIEARITPDDPGAAGDIEELKSKLQKAGFRGYSMDVCLRKNNIHSEIVELARFVGIKYGLDSMAGKEKMIEFLEDKLGKYGGEKKAETDNADKFMGHIVEKEKEHINMALDFVKKGGIEAMNMHFANVGGEL